MKHELWLLRVLGLALLAQGLMFSSGCKVQDLQAPTNPAAFNEPEPTPTATPSPTPSPEPTPGFEEVTFDFENIDYWSQANHDYGDEYAFNQWVTGVAQAPLYHHLWSKWEVGYVNTPDPNDYEVPSPILFTLICIQDDTQRARALQGLSYTVSGYTSFLANPAVAAMNAHYQITSEVIGLSPITCRFTVTEIE